MRRTNSGIVWIIRKDFEEIVGIKEALEMVARYVECREFGRDGEEGRMRLF